MRDAIVVGAGIIGSTITAALREQGRNVLLLDDKRPLAGTPASGGHLNPSWFPKVLKRSHEPLMELLHQAWGLTVEEYRMYPIDAGITTTIWRVDTDLVTTYPFTPGRVTSILHPENFPVVRYEALRVVGSNFIEEERCRLLVVAAGVWCNELIQGPPIQRKRGVSFRMKGTLKYPMIKAWAPYKQIVAHQQSLDKIWVGDGQAILEKNWNEARMDQCRQRCQRLVGSTTELEARQGNRPYCTTDSDPCLVRRVGLRTWVVTGAGKSGTIASAWAALRILKESSQ